jgi:hypothetical protein
MKGLESVLYLSAIFLAFSCSNSPEGQPLVEKTARIEIDFEGSLDQYLVNFGIHSLYKGQNGFVSATIKYTSYYYPYYW